MRYHVFIINMYMKSNKKIKSKQGKSIKIATSK